MVNYVTGNLWLDDASIVGIAVNLQGVAGRGQAYEARQQSKSWYTDYRRACVEGRLRVGTVYPRHIAKLNKTFVSIPTKTEWRLGSNPPLIDISLEAFQVWLVRQPGCPSVALPLLGCGLGGLRISEVQPIIERYLATIPNVVRVYTGR